GNRHTSEHQECDVLSSAVSSRTDITGLSVIAAVLDLCRMRCRPRPACRRLLPVLVEAKRSVREVTGGPRALCTRSRRTAATAGPYRPERRSSRRREPVDADAETEASRREE